MFIDNGDYQQVVEKVVFLQSGQKHPDARRAKS
jgi:hypothetical protein